MKLLKLPNKLLHTVSKPVEDIELEVFPYLQDMIDIMKDNNGVGLSAIQVGIQSRFFIMKDRVCINPEIINKRDKNYNSKEGCLSVDNFNKKVKRYKKIKVQYQNMRGELVEENLSKLEAAIFQHELDHLNGITIKD